MDSTSFTETPKPRTWCWKTTARFVAVDLRERFLSGKEGLRIVGAHSRLGYVYYLQGQPQQAIPLYE